MATTVTITCPECQKQIKVPANIVGKKIRCKECEKVFVAQPAGSAAGKPAPKGTAIKAAKPAPAKAKPEDDEDSNPYGVTDMDFAPRCPDCANEMESPEAIICLHCGYNTRTRTKASTRKVHDTTGWDYFVWLLPGIACALTVLLLIGFDVWYCMAIEDLVKDQWYEFISYKGIKIWLCIVSIFFMWHAGKFAVKRLIFSFTPPEVEKRK